MKLVSTKKSFTPDERSSLCMPMLACWKRQILGKHGAQNIQSESIDPLHPIAVV